MSRLVSTSITQKPVDPTGGLTLAALMERRKALQRDAPQVPAQIPSPWQGASLMVNSLANNLQQTATARQEAAGRQTLAQTMAGIDPLNGPTPEQEMTMMSLDPDLAVKMKEHVISLRQQQAETAAANAEWDRRNSIENTQKRQQAGDYKTPDVSGLRQDVISDPSYKNMAQAMPIWSSIQDAAGRDTAQSDLNIVIGMAKLFDPTSVVRSSETGAVELTGDLPSSLKSQFMYLSAQPGSRLSPEVKKGLLREGQSRMAGYNSAYNNVATFYKNLATRKGIDPLDVVPDFGYSPPEEKPPEETPQTPPDPTQKPSSGVARKPDGTIDTTKLPRLPDGRLDTRTLSDAEINELLQMGGRK